MFDFFPPCSSVLLLSFLSGALECAGGDNWRSVLEFGTPRAPNILEKRTCRPPARWSEEHQQESHRRMSLGVENPATTEPANRPSLKRHDSLFGDAEVVSGGRYHGSEVLYALVRDYHVTTEMFYSIYRNGLNLNVTAGTGELGSDAASCLPERGHYLRRPRHLAAVRLLQHLPRRRQEQGRPAGRLVTHNLHSHHPTNAQVRLHRPVCERQRRR
jgi:hypothetical protein